MHTVQRLGVMTTYTGLTIDYDCPLPAQFNILDIAHALSQTCRFGGHSSVFMSVAQHCVMVSRFCDPMDAKHGLLHDGAEAYVCDLPRPLKYHHSMTAYLQLEERMQTAIYQAFRLSTDFPVGFSMPLSVKVADTTSAMIEAGSLFSPPPSWCFNRTNDNFVPLSPLEAEGQFITRYNELFIK